MNTGGSWSKVIRAHPDGFVFIANWHSNDLSIIDISDIQKPQVIQVLPCGISPRGMAFSKSGNVGLVCGFYSRNVIEIRRNQLGLFEVSFIGDPFDYPHFSGNMRDIVISANEEYAYVSNLGRNLIHYYHIPTRKIKESVLVGQHPNTIVFSDSSKNKLLVSCRESNTVCLVNINTRKVEGHCGNTVMKSTGLSSLPGGFLVTDFEQSYLEMYKKNNKI